jgi:hypothetical protein
MKKITFFLFLLFCVHTFAQKNTKISTIDFVQVLNRNKKEVIFYYQNNWEVLRKMAVQKNYIDSYQFLETSPTKEAPFSFMLITTYKNQKQFAKREKHFQELIKAKGALKLLNNKKPGEFRKVIFGKDTHHKES